MLTITCPETFGGKRGSITGAESQEKVALGWWAKDLWRAKPQGVCTLACTKGIVPRDPAKGHLPGCFWSLPRLPSATCLQYYSLHPLLPDAAHRNWGKQTLKIHVLQVQEERARGKQSGAVDELLSPAAEVNTHRQWGKTPPRNQTGCSQHV